MSLSSRPFVIVSRNASNWWSGLAPTKKSGVGGSVSSSSTVRKSLSTLRVSDLVDKIAEEHELTKKSSKLIVTSVFDQITEAVANNKKVTITDFGSFESVHVQARKARNPQTGDAIDVPAKERIKFTAFKNFKDTVNGN